MKIVDAQIHIWSSGSPSGLHRKVSSFTAEEALREMDEAGVDAALIHPPGSWDPNRMPWRWMRRGSTPAASR
ncbi:hypothetical protein ACFQY5_15260 [Paeniroseomonas aquatica]|uniref:hypothetical protein n=1 Tax=Paeniroseomonas aquatica TaxID=373043 RepID=UPI003613E392